MSKPACAVAAVFVSLQGATSASAQGRYDPGVIDTAIKLGQTAPYRRPVELARRLAEERAYWGPVVKATGFKPTE